LYEKLLHVVVLILYVNKLFTWGLQKITKFSKNHEHLKKSRKITKKTLLAETKSRQLEAPGDNHRTMDERGSAKMYPTV
jgi:hypothetical protein